MTDLILLMATLIGFVVMAGVAVVCAFAAVVATVVAGRALHDAFKPVH